MKRQRRWLGAGSRLLSGALIGLAVYLVVWVPVFTRSLEGAPWAVLDRYGADYLNQRIAPPGLELKKLRLVLIDDRAVTEPALGGWPLPRRHYATLLDRLFAAGASQVIFDVAFSAPSSFGAAEDQAFAEAIRRHPEVTMAAYERSFGDTVGFEMPLPLFTQAGARVGLAFSPTDYDLVVRRACLAQPNPSPASGAAVLPTLAGQILRAIMDSPGRPASLEFREDRWHIVQDGRAVLEGADPFRRTLIRYRGGAGTIPGISLAKALDPREPLDEVDGAVVIVGASTEILHDNHVVPIRGKDGGRKMPGVEIQCHAALAFLNQQVLDELSDREWLILSAAGMILLGVGTIWFPARWLSWITLGLAGAGSTVFLAGGSLQFFIPIGSILFSLLLLLLGNLYVRRRLLERMFKQYVPAHVVERLERDPSFFDISIANRECTVLFLDIRGFTGLTGSLPLEVLTEILNELLSRFGQVIRDHGGYVDKYMGDAVMGVFGDPDRGQNHARQAVRAGLGIGQALQAFNASRNPPKGPLRVGIGINTGPLMIGNFGGEARYEYTVIGEAVNVASRLQDATKAHGTKGFLISARTWEQAQVAPPGDTEPLPSFRPVGDLTLRGVAGAVSAFEPS